MSRGWRRAVVALVGLTACGGEPAEAPQGGDPGPDPQSRALAVLDRTPVFDGHNDLPWEIRAADEAPMDVAAYDLYGPVPGHTSIPLLQQGRVGAQFWSVYIPGEYADSGYARMQLEQIDIARRLIDRYPELILASTATDVETAMAEGKIASMLGVEGGHAIENSLGALRAYYALGARYMTLTHNVTLDWADAAQDTALSGGLSAFGEEVVREMNRLGMLVDLSHVSPATMSDALTVSEAPVIFSHSSARALVDVPRNVPDSILARMSDNGGVVMVTFVQPFVNRDAAEYDDGLMARAAELRELGLADEEIRAEIQAFRRDNPRPSASLDDIAEHIEHVRDVAGIEHIGIGSDFDGMRAPPEMPDVSFYPALFARLIERGWSDEDLGRLASGNILRALREAEAVAARIQGERGPSIATIADFD